MEYKSKNKFSIFVGVLLLVIGAFNIFLAIVAKGEANILWLLGSSLLGLSAASLTYHCFVKIDQSNQMVYKSVKALGSTKTVSYFFSDFDKVEIVMGGGQRQQGAYTAYFVSLSGSSKIFVPGGSENLEGILAKAREIAQLLNLPLDETPRIGFTLNLWERLT